MQEKLAQVEIRLQQIEQEGKMPDVEILVKPVAEITIVGAREVVRDVSQMRARCIALNAQAYAPIAAGHLKSDGISFALYYNADESGIDVEMAYVVEEPRQPLAPTGAARVHTLPAAAVAYAIYRGSYDDFAAVGQVHSELTKWIAASGQRAAGACREYYLRIPQSAEDRVGVMEIQYPIEPLH